MKRWPIFVALSLALPMVAGCGSNRVVVGLANAPSMNRTQPDESVHDVVANGNDVCGQDGRSRLRGHWPPCTGEAHAAANSPPSSQLSIPPPGDDVVTPWLEHFHSDLACPSTPTRSANLLASPSSAAWCGPR
jgi:hypothetical protein